MKNQFLLNKKIKIKQGSTAVPRNAYSNVPSTVPQLVKGAQRPVMTSPAGNLSGAPYRGTNWTQHTAQQAYRYTSPMPQTAYTAYTPLATPVCEQINNHIKLNKRKTERQERKKTRNL